MSNHNLRPGEQYYPVSNSSMKCRIYPNKSQARAIQDFIHGVHACHNMMLHDVIENHKYTEEKVDKKTGETVHFVDWSVLAKSDTLNHYRASNDSVKNCPAASLSSNVFGCVQDMKKASGGKPVERFKQKRKNKKGKIVEVQTPHYYSKSHPRMSYTVQESLRKVIPSDNHNVFYFNFAKLGKIKIRGWNQSDRYLIDGKYVNFVEFAQLNPDAGVMVTVSMDNCGDYWAVFRISYSEKSKKDCRTYKRMKYKTDVQVGIDMGKSTLATFSDGSKIENPEYADESKETTTVYHQQLSKAWGWSNPEFRKAHKADKNIQPSNNYNKLKIRNAKHSRMIARKRELYHHQQTRKIIEDYSFIGVESLLVSELMDREKSHQKYGTRKKAARHTYGLSDAAMSKFLGMIKYKADWYGRTVVSIGKFERSTGVCPHCGYVTPIKLDEHIREWDCPNCRKHNDRDKSAAIVILHKALLMSA